MSFSTRLPWFIDNKMYLQYRMDGGSSFDLHVCTLQGGWRSIDTEHNWDPSIHFYSRVMRIHPNAETLVFIQLPRSMKLFWIPTLHKLAYHLSALSTYMFSRKSIFTVIRSMFWWMIRWVDENVTFRTDRCRLLVDTGRCRRKLPQAAFVFGRMPNYAEGH